MSKKKIFRCPAYFNIYSEEHREKSLKFIKSLDKVKQQKLSHIKISFYDCVDVKAAAMVLLYAKLETLLNQSEVKITFIFSPFYPNTKRLLQNAGFNYLRNNRTSANNFNSQQKHLPIISGVGGYYREEIVDFIRDKIYQNKNFTADQEYVFSDAIQEAINNVSLHAYPNTDSENRPWWLMCDLLDDELYLVLFDQGTGIPKTFSKGNELFESIDWNSKETIQEMEKLKKYFGLSENTNINPQDILKIKSDAVAISMAMSGNLTRMIGKDEQKHGQGSKSIKKLVSSHENGKLWIFSNRGLMKYINETTLPETKNFSISLNGTLIQWNIKVTQ